MLGLAVAVMPALAASSTAKLEVNENCVQLAWPCWTTEGSASRPQPASSVTIASGGSVMFVDHGKEANIAWIGSAPACEPSVPVAPAAPKTNWEGKCTFATPGTYKFESATMFKEPPGLYSNNIDYTKYEVVVEGAATTPPTGTTPGGGTTPGTTPAGESPIGSPLSGTPTIHSVQRGSTVKGSLQIAAAGAGDRLEVDLLATAASLGKAGHKTQVVGRFVSASASAGRQSFSVKLDAKARKALKRRHRLALKVKITLTPTHGAAMSITRSVTVHA
ncbi:MAG TPA: hypothetical protein VGI24_10895 [Solirubrobacteraceae bacterium]